MPELYMEIQEAPQGRFRTTPKDSSSLTGQTFGRWTVLDQLERTEKGERKWLCRCQCGRERYVLERSLKSGGSLSCGCLRKEAVRETLSRELTGMEFGDLTVLKRAEHQRKNGGIWWQCQCLCGKTCEYPATLLTTGKRTHCGCKTQRNQPTADIAGKRFDRLVAIHPTEKRDEKGYVIWHCRCDCGKETDVSYCNLVYANQSSCGCKKKEHDQKLREFQTHMGNTSLDHIRSSKIPKDNTTGARGVYFIKGKYVAKLVFQKKPYYLGTYSNFEDAKRAREEAEEAIFQATIDYHAKWQKKAEEDPQWAEENPIQIFVERKNGGLQASFLPIIER